MYLRPIALALSLTVMGCGGAANRAPIPVPVASVPVNDVSPLPTTDPNYDPGTVTEEPDYEDPLASPSPSDDPSATPSPSPSASATASPSPSPSASPSPSPSPTATPDPYGNEMTNNGPTGFSKPAGIAIRAGKLYITDYQSGIFTDDQGLVKVFGNGNQMTFKGKGGNEFPDNLSAVASLGGESVFAAASFSNYLYLYQGGSVIQFWIGTGANVSDLQIVDNFLFVADTQNQRISRFNLSGTVDTLNFLTGINVTGLATDGQNHLLVADGTNRSIRTFTTAGVEGTPKALNGINTPGDLAFDPNTDDLYVVDAGRGKIRRLMSQGGERTFGQLSDPRRMAIDDDGTLYVVEGQFGGKRIVEFTPGKYPN